MSVTAATGDIVRPTAEPTETIAPMAFGSWFNAAEGPTKNPNRLCVLAMPEPLTHANAHGTPAVNGCNQPGFPAMNSPSVAAKPTTRIPSPKHVAITIKLTMLAKP